jgi:hypothetical protein
MGRIKIQDLPKDMKISKDEMIHILGGLVVSKYIGETEKNLLDPQAAQTFDLQYETQADNRQYTMVSNIMKVKHDTAKASINNVR